MHLLAFLRAPLWDPARTSALRNQTRLLTLAPSKAAGYQLKHRLSHLEAACCCFLFFFTVCGKISAAFPVVLGGDAADIC